MAREYAWRGLVGVLAPQGNTTVEPEFAILLPPGFGLINARMVSAAPSLTERLREYVERLSDWAAEFAEAPIGVLAMACTGASYPLGPARESELLAGLSDRIGVPAISTGQAVLTGLEALGARRVALVSPYPADLTRASIGYWQGGGLDVVRVVEARAASPSAHPLYGVTGADALEALRQLEGDTGFDAVIMLGTGAPTLRPILEQPRASGAPVLSCNLALAWRSVLAIEGAAPSADNLLAWIDRPEWAERLRARLVP